MTESTQHKLDRIRPPRVQITYDVEIGDAIQMKELPFVGGIMADLSGEPENPLPKVKDRKFVEIDRDNFNEVMAASNPRLVLQVANRLKNDGSKLNVELKFSHIDDFDPVKVLTQIEPLKKLYNARHRLSDLLTKLDGNDELDDLLQNVITSTESMEELKTLCVEVDAGSGEEAAEAAEPAKAAEAKEEKKETKAKKGKAAEEEKPEEGEE